MKKLFALVMAAMMLLCACTALADTMVVNYDSGMDITLEMPEGYTAEYGVDESGVLVATIIKGEDSLNIAMVVAADEDYDAALRLNDLTDEEKKAFSATFIEDLDDDSWTIMESGHGTQAYVMDLAEDAYDSLMIASLYHGYDIVMYASYMDGRTLTDADVALAMQFFTDLTFEVKAAE